MSVFSLREKRFFPGNYITMASQVGAIYLKMSSHVLRIQWNLRGLPSSFRSEVMVTHTELKRTELSWKHV